MYNCFNSKGNNFNVKKVLVSAICQPQEQDQMLCRRFDRQSVDVQVLCSKL